VIPISDAPRRRRFPFVTVTLIIVNVLVFLYEVSLGNRLEGFVQSFGVVPVEIVSGRDLYPPAPLGNVYLTLFTAMFLHGGLLHLASNMLFLWIFGDNVEDTFGHIGYLIFYVVCGMLASIAQVLVDIYSTVPSIGASGAIAGILGAYVVLFPTAEVRTLLILGPFITLSRIPALVLIGFWFIIQLISGIGQLGIQSETGGVAFWAHIGGFIAGVALTLVFRPHPAPVRGRHGW